MSEVASSTQISAPLRTVWSLYFDPGSWELWVDQFAAVVSSRGYPETDGGLVWRSGSAGRGEVHEHVLEHTPEERHRIEFTDPSSSGELLSTFEQAGAGTTVTLTLSYEVRSRGLFAKLSDVLFVRAQMRASLERSLSNLRLEAEDPSLSE